MEDLAKHPALEPKLWAEYRKLAGNNNSPVDRFGSIPTPFRFKLAEVCKAPQYSPNFKKTYEEICSERVRELMSLQNETDFKICIPYSGGIDSTMVLVSFLKELGPLAARERLIVYLNRNSINENPTFYEKYIRHSLNFRSSERLWEIFDGKNIYVSADFNDQLVGSWVVQEVGHLLGEKTIAKPYTRELIVEILKFKGMSDSGATFWFECLEQNIKYQNVTTITTINDFFWWTSFNLKWQAVYFGVIMRTLPFSRAILSHEMLEKCFQPFFMSHDFQRWSFSNPDLKIQNSWDSYKWHFKELIFAFNQDATYRDEKIKIGSLYHILMQNNSPIGLTSNLEFLRTIEPSEYYQPIAQSC